MFSLNEKNSGSSGIMISCLKDTTPDPDRLKRAAAYHWFKNRYYQHAPPLIFPPFTWGLYLFPLQDLIHAFLKLVRDDLYIGIFKDCTMIPGHFDETDPLRRTIFAPTHVWIAR